VASGARPVQDCCEEKTLRRQSTEEQQLDLLDCARLNTPVQLSHYLEVWDTIMSTLLVPEQADSISWSLIPDGSYIAELMTRNYYICVNIITKLPSLNFLTYKY
jgi:hypothetical protein